MGESKKEGMKNDGVDFLIKQGYKKVSAKTFISDIDLERFLNKDFSNINKTRALGFIQILEREYTVDLSDLRADYLSYEGANRPKEPETLFAETPIANKKEWQKYLPYIAVTLAVFGLAFYLFRSSVEIAQTPEPSEKLLEENKSIINKAEQNIAKLDTNENILKSSLQKEPNISDTPSASVNEDLDLDKVVLEMMKDRNISAEEYNITLDANDSSKSLDKDELNQSTVKTEVKQAQKVLTEKVLPKKVEVKKEAISKGNLYINPVQKTWVGVIYLDDFTKKDFLIRKKLPLDASRDQLIVIGHSKFKIYNKTYSVKFRGKGPVRFIYKDGELMEISKKEFKKTSAGVAW